MLKANYPPEMLNEARLRMARIPDGASLVKNPVSHAPGFRIENVYVFAGVPAIMQAMFEEIAHELEGGPPAESVTVSCFLGEGTVAARLREIQEEWRPAVEIGSYPFYRKQRYGTSIVFRSRDPGALDAAATRFRAIVRGSRRGAGRRGESPDRSAGGGPRPAAPAGRCGAPVLPRPGREDVAVRAKVRPAAPGSAARGRPVGDVRQRPSKTGVRFSFQARTPSRKSCERRHAS